MSHKIIPQTQRKLNSRAQTIKRLKHQLDLEEAEGQLKVFLQLGLKQKTGGRSNRLISGKINFIMINHITSRFIAACTTTIANILNVIANK